jgi:hypothetical protein
VRKYKIDLDYESYLFDSNYLENSNTSQKVIREFEYIFFLVNKELCILNNVRNYDKNYLNKLLNLGFFIPELNPNADDVIYWWGNRHNYSLEQTLNSKITSANLAKKMDWGFTNGKLVSNVNQLEEHVNNFKKYKEWIIKRPFGFSGQGHYQFNSENYNKFIVDKILIGEVLLEPVYDRLFDIGTTFVIEEGVIKKQFMVENFNSKNGGFRGGAGAATIDKFKSYIQEKYNYCLDELEQVTLDIAKKYLEMGAINNIQIDSFIYIEDGAMKLYPLVEVNYRKTMGLVIQSLAEEFSQYSRIEWILRTKKETEEDFYITNGEMIRLSPDGTYFNSYLKKIE